MMVEKETGRNSRPGEFELISRYFAPLSGEGSFGLLDDAALLAIGKGKAMVLTQDAIAAGIHFLPDDPPSTIAKKALRVNLSDLAAKGAVPTGFSLALGLHPDWDETWIAGFAAGLAEDCRQFDLKLSGGDTFRSPGGPVISITAWGEINAKDYASRLSARPGDVLFVTGTIGDAALGLKVRLEDPDYRDLTLADALLARYLVPEPPVKFAPLIARFASAAMDVSDGLVGDLEKMAAASGVDFHVSGASLPLSPAVRQALQVQGAMRAALTGGDDYQIAFTIPSLQVSSFRRAAQDQDVRVTAIGTTSKGEGRVHVDGPPGAEVASGKTSYSHF